MQRGSWFSLKSTMCPEPKLPWTNVATASALVAFRGAGFALRAHTVPDADTPCCSRDGATTSLVLERLKRPSVYIAHVILDHINPR
jgi:hypothetical protein